MALTKISGSILKDPLNLGEVSIGGTLTYQDVTNVDSVGIITARSTIDAQGSINLADSIIHTGDTDTKIRFPADDKVRIELGGVSSAFSGLKSTSGANHARWGINVATPQAVLHIDEVYNHQGLLRVTNNNQNSSYYHQLEMSGTSNVFTLWKHYDGSSAKTTHIHGSTRHAWYIGGDEKVRIHSDGNVGIGLTNPSSKLEVRTTGQDSGIRLVDSSLSSGSPNLEIISKRIDGNNNTAFSSNIFLGKNRTDAKVSSGIILGTINFGGNHTDGSESNISYSAGIRGVASDSFDSKSDMPTDLVFATGTSGTDRDGETASQSNVGTERIRITSTGRINIGDADQTQDTDQLCVSVSANNAVDNVARFQSAAAASGTSESLIKVYKGAGYGGVISGYITQGSDHGMKFYTANNGALTERLRINKSGHVTMPHLPAFHARPPGHYQLNAGPSDTIIGGTWSTGDPESFAQGSLPNGTSIWDNSTGVFTVPVDGVYSIHWNVFLKNNTERRDAMIYLNGTGSGTIIARTEIQNPGSAGRNKNVAVHTIVHLSATDEIRFGVLSDGSANRLYLSSKPWSYACAALIG